MAKTEKYCWMCDCDGHEIPESGDWDCPLIGKKICDTCCQIEFAAGMGAPDTAAQIYKQTQKTPQEAYAMCKACPHGGEKVGGLGEVVYVKPGTEKEHQQFEDGWAKKLAWLRGELKEEA